jgi:hypothetical protein
MAGSQDGADGSASGLDVLHTLLRTATGLLEEIAASSDALRERWTQVFERMPAEDRKAILQVVEREVSLRLLEREGGGDSLTGFRAVHPNPNARLYVRVFGPQTPYHSRDEIIRATLRTARMMLLTPAGFRDDWAAGTLEAFRRLDPAERQAVATLSRELLALIARVTHESKKAS